MREAVKTLRAERDKLSLYLEQARLDLARSRELVAKKEALVAEYISAILEIDRATNLIEKESDMKQEAPMTR